MQVIVLGLGYIGSSLVQYLLDRGDSVVALDNCFSTDLVEVAKMQRHPGFRLIKGDVADTEAVSAAFGAAEGSTLVFNLAAQSSAAPSAASSEYTERTNLTGPRVALDALLQHGGGTMVYASSLRVYGDALPDSVDESANYGRFSDLSHLSKCYVEKLMEMYSGLHGLRCLSIRLGLVYGVAPIMKTDYRFMTAPNKFCLQAVRGEEIVVWGSGSVGLIHVVDAAQALLTAAECSQFEGYMPINGVTEIATIADVAMVVASEGERRGLPVRLRLPLPATNVQCSLTSKLTTTPFAARYSLFDGVAETLDHFASRQGM